MRRVALTGALILAVACSRQALHDGRSTDPIIGGQPSLPGEYPETGVLLTVYDFGGGQTFGSFVCTGTLVAPDVVMMAGHCTIDFLNGAVPFKNYFSFQLDVSMFGMQSLDLPPDAIEFDTLIPHPLFDFNTEPAPGLNNYNDVGLGFLKAPFASPVPGVVADAQDGATLGVGTDVVIVGYGQTSATSMAAGVKNQAVTFINEINQYEMQIGDVPPGDPQKCHGDSGGPTFVDIDDGRPPLRRVIGITSRAYDDSDCNKGGIDMRADAFRTWFDQMMRDRCTQGLRPPGVCANGGGLPVAGDPVPPPLDAGFLDTGIEPDSGVVEKDAAVADAQPFDSGEIAADSGTPVERDAGVIGGGGRRRDGCSCTEAERPGARGVPPRSRSCCSALRRYRFADHGAGLGRDHQDREPLHAVQLVRAE